MWGAVRDEFAVLLARRGAQKLVRRLGLRPQDGLQQLVEAIERERGRRIIISEKPLTAELSGLCIETRHADIIFVDSSATTPLLRLVIVLHELRHLLHDTGGRRQRLMQAAGGLLERWHLRAPRAAAPRDPDHSVFSTVALAALAPGLPQDLVREIVERGHPVHGRAPHHDPLDIGEVFAREVLTMLAIHDDPTGLGAIASSLDHRRTGI